MKTYSRAFEMLRKSIWGSDKIILVFAMFCLFFLVASLKFKKDIEKSVVKINEDSNEVFSRYLYRNASFCYTLFVAIISLFPLLGMLGTVVGLLGLDFAADNINNIKSNFFVALTSTAWGIIFSVIYKIVHALVADGIEEQLEIAKKMTEESKNK